MQRSGSNAALHAALAEAYVRKYDETRRFAETPDKQSLENAMESGRRAVAANFDLAAGHVALGMALAASGERNEAATEFERALDLNPKSGPAHLGLAKLRSGPKREQLHQTAVKYSPRDWIPLYELGVFYFRNARYDDSVVAWGQALELARGNVPVMSYLAGAFHMKGQYAEAADFSQRALELDATSAEAWANYGTARHFQGRYAEAVRAMEKAVKLAPRWYLYWGNLGDGYRWAEGQKNKAGEAYAEAIRLARRRLDETPNDERLRGSLAVYLAKSGDAAGALAELGQIQEVRPSDTGTLFKTALVYEFAHDRVKALAALGRAIRAGYSMHEIANEPDLADLRSDTRYSRIASAAANKQERLN